MDICSSPPLGDNNQGSVFELSNGEVGRWTRFFISWIFILTKIVGLEGWGGGFNPPTPVHSNPARVWRGGSTSRSSIQPRLERCKKTGLEGFWQIIVKWQHKTLSITFRYFTFFGGKWKYHPWRNVFFTPPNRTEWTLFGHFVEAGRAWWILKFIRPWRRLERY